MMEHLIAVTDRNLCQRDFFVQIERICRQKPDRIILREKDLPDDIYIKYVQKCKILCSAYGIPLSVNGRIEIAKSLSVPDIHLSYQALIGRPEVISEFSHTGVSIHSVEEAAQAARLGVSYIIAGHIFATDCKKRSAAQRPAISSQCMPDGFEYKRSDRAIADTCIRNRRHQFLQSVSSDCLGRCGRLYDVRCHAALT